MKGMESIAYGADWYRGKKFNQSTTDSNRSHLHKSPEPEDANKKNERAEMMVNPERGSEADTIPTSAMVASCTFYDHQLQLWKTTLT